MIEPKLIEKLKLVVLVCAALLLLNVAPAPNWAAGFETDGFKLSLSMSGESVRFRTEAFDCGQSGFSLMLESRR